MVAAAALLAAAPARALTLPERPAARVNDFAGALSPEARARLEAQLASYERNSSAQIAVAIVRSLEGQPIEDVSMRLAEKWKIGSRADDGVLVVVATDDHRFRIEVGYGLESRLTDAQAGRILRDVMAPRFREGKLEEGLSAGLAAIETAVIGRTPPGAAAPVPDEDRAARRSPAGLWLIAILFVIALGVIDHRRRRRSLGGWPLFFGGWLGGSGGWSRRSGGGFSGGGFSGGGGSFGGGGASGSW
ncbi:MAG TPA: TPM domain-containing protein [Polyangia bacterium]|nr:TPM domain-containing protein [Polyangia bacterium]